MCKGIFIICLSKWDTFITPLLLMLRDLFRRGSAKTVRARSGGWLPGNSVFQTQQDWCIHELPRECKQPAHLPKLQPDKTPAWTIGSGHKTPAWTIENGHKSSPLAKKLFKIDDYLERKSVFFKGAQGITAISWDRPHVKHSRPTQNGLRASFSFLLLYFMREKEYGDEWVGRLRKIWKELETGKDMIKIY